MVVRKPELMRTELYADWFAPQRFHSVMAAPTLFENDASAVLVAFRDRSRGDFEAADLARAERFAGHFGAALRFRFAQERTAAELAAANFVLDELPDAIFLVSRAGLLRHANAAGRTMLEAGTPLRSLQGRLELHPSASPSGWSACYSRRAASFARRSRVTDHGSFSSTRARGGLARSGRLPDRSSDRPRPAGTAARPGETQPALGPDRPPGRGGRRAGESGSEESASAELHVSKATLHTHLSRVYDHLGVHNRAALVALLARHGFDVPPGEGGEKI